MSRKSRAMWALNATLSILVVVLLVGVVLRQRALEQKRKEADEARERLLDSMAPSSPESREQLDRFFDNDTSDLSEVLDRLEAAAKGAEDR